MKNLYTDSDQIKWYRVGCAHSLSLKEVLLLAHRCTNTNCPARFSRETIYPYMPLIPRLRNMFADENQVKGLVDRFGIDFSDPQQVQRALTDDWPSIITRHNDKLDSLRSFSHPLEGLHFRTPSRRTFLSESPWNISLAFFYDGFDPYYTSSAKMHVLCFRPLNMNTAIAHRFIWPVSFLQGKEPKSLMPYSRPMLQELKTLSKDGVVVYNALLQRDVIVKAELHLLTADSPARAKVLSLVAPTAYNGCCYCPMSALACNCRKHRDWSKAAASDRTHLSANQFTNFNYSFVGKLPYITPPNTCSIETSFCSLDTLHSFMLCSGKRLLSLTLESMKPFVHTGKGSVLRNKRAALLGNDTVKILEVDLRLAITVWPAFVMRKPRLCSAHHKSYTAEEMLNFVLVCGKHIFLGLVDERKQAIWWNFSEMTRIAMSKVVKVDPTTLDSLNKLTSNTIGIISETFGNCNVPITTHHLSHLARACQQHGPPAHVSTFPFERAINQYGRLIRPGTHDEIVPRLVARIALQVNPVVSYAPGRKFGVLTRLRVPEETMEAVVAKLANHEHDAPSGSVYTEASVSKRMAEFKEKAQAFQTLTMSVWGSRPVSLAKVSEATVLQFGDVVVKPARFWRIDQSIWVEVASYYRPSEHVYGKNPLYQPLRPRFGHEIVALDSFTCSGYCHELTNSQFKQVNEQYNANRRLKKVIQQQSLQRVNEADQVDERARSCPQNDPNPPTKPQFIMILWHLNMRDLC
ncbi:hypothetical protein CAOG_03158 [Capsaspora owczarzaki ATCC 30864]|uniref:hypothetical protein n=1 Tax=Capsaspora owczarzaki (strain ATCC 30864) TaxID=595528 RepID=UPI0001FE6E9F|nr:hypothetical protein CAOG_03158 [Capsaspora owczarzaki ATCC 30864]|eukprot:XP_004363997.1 hypothetical protein CAOG_03158 [Capsaspora owczarzaki ATCC 30864]